jgi:hypothetical protein
MHLNNTITKNTKNNARGARIISLATVTAFIISFVVNQAAAGALSLTQEHVAAARFEQSGRQFVLPYQFGRITGGNYRNPEKLVVYIQDLHCHPEVQKNISRIIQFFDTRFNVGRILVEGAPAGKLDAGILTSLPDGTIKNKTLDSLLNVGVLSGAEYYETLHNGQKLYGLERWDAYAGNLARLQQLLTAKEKNNAIAAVLQAKIAALRKTYLPSRLERLSGYLLSMEDKEQGTEKKSLLLERWGQSAGEPLIEYPHLYRYVASKKLARQISFFRLQSELESYEKYLSSILPFRLTTALKEKLRDGERTDEYYWRLNELAAEYTPRLSHTYPNLAKFLEYQRLNYALNPGYLLQEEAQYGQRILEKSSPRLIDKEILFLSKMGALFQDFVSLQITPDEYSALRKNAVRFAVVLKKYFALQDVEAAIALLNNETFARFYAVNFERNADFIQAIIGGGKGAKTENNSTVTGGYPAVLSRLADFTTIDIVVAGGFHSAIADVLDQKNISYLSIIPNVSKTISAERYEQIVNGEESFAALSSAIAPPLLQVLQQQRLSPELEKILHGYIDVIVVEIIRQSEQEHQSAETINESLQRLRISTRYQRDSGSYFRAPGRNTV